MDPLLALEHDHVHLSRLVSELRAAFDGEPGDPEEMAATLAALRDDLFEHFAREEEALFPYLMEALPDLRSAIARLEDAHDRICGAVSRLHAVAAKGSSALREQHALAEQLFRRFDSDYIEHARHESEFLRSLSARLNEEQRTRVRALMRDV
jgi:iron-sulfur cluster repair protein YtfE (RIC family)